MGSTSNPVVNWLMHQNARNMSINNDQYFKKIKFHTKHLDVPEFPVRFRSKFYWIPVGTITFQYIKNKGILNIYNVILSIFTFVFGSH